MLTRRLLIDLLGQRFCFEPCEIGLAALCNRNSNNLRIVVARLSFNHGRNIIEKCAARFDHQPNLMVGFNVPLPVIGALNLAALNAGGQLFLNE